MQRFALSYEQYFSVVTWCVSASQMSSENVELRVDLEYLSNMMRESKESLLSYFDTQFYSFSNKSVQYALVEYDEVVAWNLGTDTVIVTVDCSDH